MRYKQRLIELAWLIATFIGSYLLLIVITPDNKAGISINLHDTYYFIPLLSVVTLVFILLTGLIYFIKGFFQKLKTPLQIWVAYTSVILSCVILTFLTYIYGGFIDAIRNIYTADSMRSPLIPDSIPDLLVIDAYKMTALATLRTAYFILLLVMILRSRKLRLAQSTPI